VIGAVPRGRKRLQKKVFTPPRANLAPLAPSQFLLVGSDSLPDLLQPAPSILEVSFLELTPLGGTSGLQCLQLADSQHGRGDIGLSLHYQPLKVFCRGPPGVIKTQAREGAEEPQVQVTGEVRMEGSNPARGQELRPPPQIFRDFDGVQ